ncbi:hypothetical protein Zmor_013945 [Zophobas morio]|uniref:Uncharacterized protein n=1 Tax=Zophobas morio TaxID=2755281 RepID=A0AA38IG75_9CUCU|nr:hypothetical protein Zmor_013945 [Zophobas morio]
MDLDAVLEADEFVPNDVTEAAEAATNNLLRKKSRNLYEKEYTFYNWRRQKKTRGLNKDIILPYLSEKAKNVKSLSLWSYYSMLKAVITLKEKKDIGRCIPIFILSCDSM